MAIAAAVTTREIKANAAGDNETRADSISGFTLRDRQRPYRAGMGGRHTALSEDA